MQTVTVHRDEHFKIWGVEIIGFGWKPSDWVVPVRSVFPTTQALVAPGTEVGVMDLVKSLIIWNKWMGMKMSLFFFRVLFIILSFLPKRHFQWIRKRCPFCNPVPGTQLSRVQAEHFCTTNQLCGLLLEVFILASLSPRWASCTPSVLFLYSLTIWRQSSVHGNANDLG